MIHSLFKPSPAKTHLALLSLRLMLAVVFIYHGSQKLFGLFGGHGLTGFAGYLASLGVPLPSVSAFLAASAEFVGGLALLSGLGLSLMAIPLSFTMLVAAFTAHSGFNAVNGGNEYPLVLAVAVIALGLTGPGAYTLSALWQQTPQKPGRKSELTLQHD